MGNHPLVGEGKAPTRSAKHRADYIAGCGIG